MVGAVRWDRGLCEHSLISGALEGLLLPGVFFPQPPTGITPGQFSLSMNLDPADAVIAIARSVLEEKKKQRANL